MANRCQSKNKQNIQCGFPEGHRGSHGNGNGIRSWTDSDARSDQGRDTIVPSLPTTEQEERLIQAITEKFQAEIRTIIIKHNRSIPHFSGANVEIPKTTQAFQDVYGEPIKGNK